MVKFNLYILIFSINVSLYAQNDTLKDDYSIMVVSQAPYFKYNKSTINDPFDDEMKLKEFITYNLCYRNLSKPDTLVRTVFVSFWIDTTGYTYDHEIIRGVSEDLDKEALRVTKLIQFEKPAMQKGKPIKIKTTVPVKFDITQRRKMLQYLDPPEKK